MYVPIRFIYIFSMFSHQVNVVFMQTNSTLKEILLPLNGALVLDNNVRISFTDDSSVQPECTGEGRMVLSPWIIGTFRFARQECGLPYVTSV